MRGIVCAVMENEGRKKAIKKRIYNRDLCGGGGEGCRFLFDGRFPFRHQAAGWLIFRSRSWLMGK